MSRPSKITPAMVRAVFSSNGRFTNNELAVQLNIGKRTVQAIRSGTLAMDEACQKVWHKALASANGCRNRAVTRTSPPNDPLATVAPIAPKNSATALKSVRAKKLAPECLQHAEAIPVSPETVTEPETVKEDPMLLVNAGLKPETRAHFKLPRNPFVDDVQSPDDVFQTPSVRYIRAALTDCALHHGFMAVVGESGAGKSTLAEDLAERIRIDGRNIVLIKPYVLAMEGNDERGKTLKSSQIAESIAVALDPSVRLRATSEARFRQLHTLLMNSRRSGQRHLLVIEEAHCLPLATLKHLKRFLELKDGMQRLLGVALIGQPELRERLSGHNAEVREVAQRCELVELEPLDAELEGYLQHKFARFDLKLSDVFTPDAFDAMRARLIHRPRGGKPSDARSLCFPLVVNNLVCRAMNAAAAAHWPQVDSQVIAGC